MKKINNNNFLTFDQENYVCGIIDEWYMEWRDQILVRGQPDMHRLGYAKEKLKLMVCGDTNESVKLREV